MSDRCPTCGSDDPKIPLFPGPVEDWPDPACTDPFHDTAPRPDREAVLRERLDSDARACQLDCFCRVNGGTSYCLFGPADECNHVAAEWLRLRAIEDAAREDLAERDAECAACVKAMSTPDEPLVPGGSDCGRCALMPHKSASIRAALGEVEK